jgi:hypothetical protein
VWPSVPSRLSERASIGWVAGALLAAGALVFWSYQSSSRETPTVEMIEAPPTSTRALVAAKVESARQPSEAPSGAHPRRPLAGSPNGRQLHAAQVHAERAAEPQELPDIIRTDELPTAPEVDDVEAAENEAAAEGFGSEGEANGALSDTPPSPPAPAPIARSVPAGSAPAASAPAASVPAANTPAPSITASNTVAAYRKPIAQRSAPKPAPASVPNRKAASAKAAPNCNPPFYFDNNNIRRLKLECL